MGKIHCYSATGGPPSLQMAISDRQSPGHFYHPVLADSITLQQHNRSNAWGLLQANMEPESPIHTRLLKHVSRWRLSSDEEEPYGRPEETSTHCNSAPCTTSDCSAQDQSSTSNSSEPLGLRQESEQTKQQAHNDKSAESLDSQDSHDKGTSRTPYVKGNPEWMMSAGKKRESWPMHDKQSSLSSHNPESQVMMSFASRDNPECKQMSKQSRSPSHTGEKTDVATPSSVETPPFQGKDKDEDQGIIIDMTHDDEEQAWVTEDESETSITSTPSYKHGRYDGPSNAEILQWVRDNAKLHNNRKRSSERKPSLQILADSRIQEWPSNDKLCIIDYH